MLAALPRAATVDERFRVRHMENETVLEQLRSFLHDTGASTDGHIFPVACECGRGGDELHVQLTVGEFERLLERGERLVAERHAASSERPA